MALRPDYTSGTITLTAGSTTVTGTGTAWTIAPARAGDELIDIAGAMQYRPVIAADATSDTQLTLTRPWPGATMANVGYRLRFRADAERVTGEAVTLIETIRASALAAFAGVAPGPRKGIRFDATSAASLFDLSDKALSLLAKTDEAGMRDMLTVAKKQADVLDTTPGAGLIVGAFGLGGFSPARFAGDVNTILTNGLRAVDSTAGNLPAVIQGILRTEMWDNISGGVQTLMSIADYRIWRRQRANSTWSAWSQTMDAFGSNSNGIYFRSATGLQICAGNYTSGVSKAFPAAFASKPFVTATADTGAVVTDRYATALNVSTTAYTIQTYLVNNGSPTMSSANGSMVAVGVY